MHISQIRYGIKVPTGTFQNETIEVTIDVENPLEIERAIELARTFVWTNHKQNNPHLYQDQEIKISDIANAVIENKQRPKDSIQGMIFDIQSVTELTVLKSYELLCKNNPKLQDAYQLKLNELSK